jgi:(4S)-4-hydroxy-5-phosphonooxypentane-2,3-dione isomerase
MPERRPQHRDWEQEWYALGMSETLLVVHVHVHVKPEHVDAFLAATLANARASVQEPGIARFDVVQDQEDPTRFVLVEAYRDASAPAAHKATPHYEVWRDTVASMMAEPRSSRKYNARFPAAEGW